jgi:multiple sugar transport system ATP-binding protein
MRASLTQLHDRLGVTTVYVTHDQVEAMTLGHRVCVMRDGKLQQVDTPQALFDAPVNLFVAGFIGSPAMNFVIAELVRDGGPAVTFAGHKLPLTTAIIDARPGLSNYFGREVILGVRPSDFEDASLADSGWARLSVHADVTEELGSEIHVIFSIDAAPVRHATISDIVDESEDSAAIVLASGKSLWTGRVAARSRVRPGQEVELAVDTTNLQFFDPVSALSIGHPGAAEHTDAPAEAPVGSAG